MAQQQIQINLQMTADTAQAKKQLADLQTSLNTLVADVNKSGDFKLTTQVKEASVAVAKLQTSLKAAVDVNTGKLDLSKFSQQLKQSNMTLESYKQNLMALGPEGEKAFTDLVQSLTMADSKLVKTNNLLNKMWGTMKNTMKWQLSSSLLHGFMGAVSSAYGYAQDLNESLNNIRIVTGQNTDQMAKFAEQANNAAKALSTSTTAYTDAALIFYQQGLKGQDVTERTDAVVKMSNVTKDSVDTVSSYMTAIWNNFDDGSESLEHYADVITALGASTASSSAEIAAGLEKFAAIGNQIGLSYDYATSALATVVATTRQSEDVVGTAFKTIFARIQGLSLGETAEDGTNLNKYSKALEKVGIDIKTASGGVKDMNTILDEMGEKWKSLSKDTQLALAQTVAGTRQYNQLVALMENWDFFKENVNTAQNSDGSLQKQQDIYAESWEAAGKRVKASLQSIYAALLDDKFFIKLTDGFAKFIDLINNAIKGLGGLKGTLLMIGSIITQVFQKQMISSLNSLAPMLFGAASGEKIRDEATAQIANLGFNDGTVGGIVSAETYIKQAELQNILKENAAHMNEQQIEIAQHMLDQNKALQENIRLTAESAKSAQKQADAEQASAELIYSKLGRKNTLRSYSTDDKSKTLSYTEALRETVTHKSNLDTFYNNNLSKVNNSDLIGEQGKQLSAQIDQMEQAYAKLGLTMENQFSKKGADAIRALNAELKKSKPDLSEINRLVREYGKAQSAATTNAEDREKKVREVIEAEVRSRNKLSATDTLTASQQAEIDERVRELTGSFQTEATEVDHVSKGFVQLGEATDFTAKKMQEMRDTSITLSDSLVKTMSFLTAFSSAISTIESLWKTFTDDSISSSEKMQQGISSLAMVIPSLTFAIKGLASIWGKTIAGIGLTAGAVLGPVLAVVGAIWAVLKIYDTWFNKEKQYEKSLENLGDSVDKWKSTTDEVKNLSSEIESLSNQVDELNKKDTLTLADQQDLKNLQAEISLLETKKAILDAQKDNEKQEVKNAFKDIQSTAPSDHYSPSGTVWDDAASQVVEKVYSKSVNLDLGSISYTDESAITEYKAALAALEVKKDTDSSINQIYTQLKQELDLFEDAKEKYVKATNEIGDKAYDVLTTISKEEDQGLYRQALEAYSQQQVVNGTASNSATKALKNGYTDEKGKQVKFSKEEIENIVKYSNGELEHISVELQTKLKQAAESVYLTESDLLESLKSSAIDATELTKVTAADLANSLSSAETLDQLTAAYQNFINNNKDIIETLDFSPFEEYSNALINLANNYENCAQEVKNLQIEMQYGTEDSSKLAKNELEASIMAGEAAEKYKLSAQEIEIQARAFQEENAELKDNIKLATQIAIVNQRLNKGVTTLSKNWETWKKSLTASDKTTTDYANTVADLTDVIADLVNAGEGFELPNSFDIQSNLEDIEKAAKGDINAINRLNTEIFKTSVMDIENPYKNLESGTDTSYFDSLSGQFSRAKAIVLNGIDDIQNALSGVNIGEGLEWNGDQDWAEALNTMAYDTAMTVDDMNAKLNQLGVQAEVVTAKKEVDQSVPWYRTQETVDVDGGVVVRESHVVASGLDTVKGEVEVAQINTGDNRGEKPIFTAASRGSVSPGSVTPPSGGGGKSSNKAKKKDYSKKKDTVERYKEVTDSINDVERAYDRANKKADTLFGTAKIQSLNEQNKLLKDRQKLLNQKQGEAEGFLVDDTNALQAAIAELGGTFNIEGGNIVNYTEELNKVFDQLAEAEKKYNSFATSDQQSEYEESTLQPLRDKIDALKDAISQYEETRDLIEELKDQQEELHRQWQANNYEKITYEVELKLNIQKNNLDEINVKMELLNDNVYTLAEAFEILNNEQLPETEKSVEIYQTELDKLTNAYVAGEITQQDYIDGLQQVHDGAIQSIEDLMTLDETMREYYGETLSKINDELSKYSDHLEHLTSVLSHYQTILELTGRTQDYVAKNALNEAIQRTKQNSFDVAQNKYNMLQKQLDQERELIKKNLNGMSVEELLGYTGDDTTIQEWKKRWLELQKTVDEAHEGILSSAEDLMNQIEKTYTDRMEAIGKEMENTMTNGMGFDALNDSMKRISQNQDEFLTKTNQIYEVNKLQRSIQQDIDKTTNTAAKQNLANFSKEIAALEEKDKLSNLELEIAQARYKQLQAQIALEEAQNAKSTVRLSRDSEGNYGYVYTADQDKVNDAQQALADADNDLYNLLLNAANDYAQKKIQAEQELTNALLQIDENRKNGMYKTEEDYQKARETVIKEYADLIETYSYNYSVATSIDARVAQDAWTSTYSEIIKDGESWKAAVETETEAASQAYQQWSTDVDTVAKAVGLNLDNVEDSIADVVEESDNLADITNDKVIPALESEASRVQSLTADYLAQRQAVLNLISALQTLASTSSSQISTASGTKAKTNYTSLYYQTGDTKYLDQHDAARKNQGWTDAQIAAERQTILDVEDRVHAKGLEDDPDAVKKALNIVECATGGYTGEWGSEGKLAILHEKELVLNQDDTINLLQGLEITHKIMDFLSNLTIGSSGLFSSSLTNTTKDTLEQQVSISATFPSVTDHNEIEQAFNTLINRASQYANRK